MKSDSSAPIIDEQQIVIEEAPQISVEESVGNEVVMAPTANYSNAFKDILYIGSGTLPVQLVKGLVPFSNSIMLAHVNNDIRAATTLVNTLEDFTSIILNSPLFYVSTAVGVLNNDEDKGKIGQTVQASWLLALCCAAPQVALLAFSKPILDGSGQENDITELVSKFFRIYLFSVPLLSLQSVTDQLAQATKHIYLPAVVQTIGFSSSVVLAYALTYGAWGAPNLDMRGVAWSSLARVAINTLLYTTYLLFASRNQRSFAPYRLFKWHSEGFSTVFKKLCLNGLPMLVVFGSEIGGLYLMNMFVGKLGRDPLSAQLVISQYQDFLMVPISAFGSAAQVTISNSLRENKKSIKRYGNAGIILSLIIPGIYTALAATIPNTMMYPFLDPNEPTNRNVVELLDKNKLLLISGVNLSLTAVRMVSAQSLIGAKVIGWPLVVNMLTTWIGVGVGYALAFELDYGIVGLSLGLGSGLLISAAAQSSYWLFKANGLIATEDEKKPLIEEEAVSILPEGSSINAEPPISSSPTVNKISERRGFFSSFGKGKQKGEQQPLLKASSETGEEEAQQSSKRSLCSIM